MMKIFVANKKSKIESIKKKYPNATICDITSKSKYPGLRILSPFYPHGNIPIPGMDKSATCVEAVWQGLKVFENCGVDDSVFRNDTMEGIKRTVRKFGKPLGHFYFSTLLDYAAARWYIYLPTYLYVLEKVPKVQETLKKIKEQLNKTDIVFLDYNTNCNVVDYSKPLSHAGLVKLYLEGKYPKLDDREEYEKNNGLVKYANIDHLIASIEHHPKFNIKRHGDYVKVLRSMSIDLKQIKDLSRKRDGWKTIVNDVQNKDYSKSDNTELDDDISK